MGSGDEPAKHVLPRYPPTYTAPIFYKSIPAAVTHRLTYICIANLPLKVFGQLIKDLIYTWFQPKPSCVGTDWGLCNGSSRCSL